MFVIHPGNLKNDGRLTYTSDAADRPVKVESTAFTHPAPTPPPLLAVTGAGTPGKCGYLVLHESSHRLWDNPSGVECSFRRFRGLKPPASQR